MRAKDKFDLQFAEWLSECLHHPIPKTVRAFSFGISQQELCFAVELNGTSEFDAKSDLWTWSEVWSPQTGKLRIPTSICGGQHSACTQHVKHALLHYLENGLLRKRLLGKSGVAIDSMDAGYELIWHQPKTPIKRLLRR